ncbi:RHS repeat-associated core domain-containing protein, partial [Snodgrassella sp.]|uniref:RHS repeat domain-containing protein n=1 Tax=Snodgrassella sp. TaxID=2815304 RepID=UPI00258A0B2B
TRFLWDGLRMIQETGPNHPTSLYIYTDQNSYEPLARIDKRSNEPERVMYFHTDLNGCPEELTDENGEILWECSFQLWGKRIHEIEHESIEQNLRYQGQYLDRETGLHYNTFRYYDPDIGRFTQPDPIGLLGGFNLYQYAPNGLTWIDPWGWIKCGIGKYKDVGGHHVHAKAGFKNNLNYDPKKGFSISQDYMNQQGWRHQDMTNYQRKAFTELFNSGRPNTLAEHTRIAVGALKAGGATHQQARNLVAQSLWNLRSQGVTSPSNIPWN